MLQSGLFIQMVLHRANESWPRVHVWTVSALSANHPHMPKFVRVFTSKLYLRVTTRLQDDARLLHSRFTEIPLPVLGYERS
jgi:hypothetical protein